MHIVLTNADDHSQLVNCPVCHWQGTAAQLIKGEHLPLTNVTEIFCPECKKYLGFIQHDEENPA
jgi:hypothetical protein